MATLEINRKNYEVDLESETPLLWALRDHLKLHGTKYGCGIEQCGACTVHVNGRAVRSCGITVREVTGKAITNICRCGTYNQVREAIHRAAQIKEGV